MREIKCFELDVLRSFIRHKIGDGHLPYARPASVRGGLSRGETCDACGIVLAPEQFNGGVAMEAPLCALSE
jgi:hypothetical protein